jgi:hypothetical protein
MKNEKTALGAAIGLTKNRLLSRRNSHLNNALRKRFEDFFCPVKPNPRWRRRIYNSTRRSIKIRHELLESKPGYDSG